MKSSKPVRLPGIVEFKDGPGKAMEPFAKNGRSLKFDTFHYAKNPLKRLDVIIFALSNNEFKIFPKKVTHNDRTFVNPSFQYVKRVIGLPGETIQFTENDILINGESLKLNRNLAYLKSGFDDYGKYKFGAKSFKIPTNGVFVISDNTKVGIDSRHMGTIPLRCVFGLCK